MNALEVNLGGRWRTLCFYIGAPFVRWILFGQTVWPKRHFFLPKNRFILFFSSTLELPLSVIFSRILNRKMSLPKLYLSDFEIFHPLGGGHCGNVYLAKRKCDAALVALKVVDRYKISDHLGEQMRRDFVLLPTLKHPHLVEMYGHFFYDERIYISFEYINGGTLYQRLEKAGGGRFEDKEAAKVRGL